jgi:hypothetical protein
MSSDLELPVIERITDDGAYTKVIKVKNYASKRVMVGIPTTGLVRMEWALNRFGQVVPCNWSQLDCVQWLGQCVPLGFLVAEARNVIVAEFIEKDFEWLFFIDHDVVLPLDTTLKFNHYMLKGDVPIFGGIYFTKSVPSEPLIYRGRGNSYYTDWKFGDKVWVDGIHMGCTVIHRSILKAVWDESEEYNAAQKLRVRRVFETPARVFFDPEKHTWFGATGTEDLEFCTRLMTDDIFRKAGWPEYQKKEFPILMDTSVFCRHIDQNGVQYPAMGEEQQFMPREE